MNVCKISMIYLGLVFACVMPFGFFFEGGGGGASTRTLVSLFSSVSLGCLVMSPSFESNCKWYAIKK